MTDGAKLEAAQATSLASTLAGLHSEVTDLESNNNILREKVNSLHDAVAPRERAREDEILSLRESLLSTKVSFPVHV